MAKYYAISSENFRGFKSNNGVTNKNVYPEVYPEINSSTFAESFRKKITYKKTITKRFLGMEYDDWETKVGFVSDVPAYVILEKKDNDYYEIYTGTKIVLHEKYLNGVGLFYLNYKNESAPDGDYKVTIDPIIPFNEDSSMRYVKDWETNTELSISRLKEFIEKSKKDFSLIIELDNKDKKQNQDALKQFQKTLNTYKK